MGGRGSKSPQAKQGVKNVSRRALIWAKSRIGNSRYGRGAWNGTFFYGTAKCNLFVERAFNQGNPEEKPFIHAITFLFEYWNRQDETLFRC